MTDAFHHVWLSGLFGDTAMSDCLSGECTLQHMIRVEAAFVRACAAHRRIDAATELATLAHLEGFACDLAGLQSGTAIDGTVVPALVQQLRADQPAAIATALHSGMTSQDVTDTALALTLRAANNIFAERLNELDAALQQLSDRFGHNTMMGRTRMQAALPIRVGDRIAAWRSPVTHARTSLGQIRSSVERVQLGGPVGTFQNAPDGPAIMQHMAEYLSLTPGPQWHTDRGALADYAHWLSRLSGGLGKFGQDIALMAQQGVDETSLQNTGSSSAMPHKQNPIMAELLVSLAKYNATLLPAMHQALVHEQDRSGSAWTLEWLVLPQMMMTAARGCVAAQTLADNLAHLGSTPRTN